MRAPEDELDDLEDRHLLRRLRAITPVTGDGVTVELDGRRLINFSSNDYLGLAHHPFTTSEAHSSATVPAISIGSGSSRLVCGTTARHLELEHALARFKHCEAALTFSSGYATALGTLQALLKKDDIVILDKLCHASLIDGVRLSGATIRVFPHNDLNKLESHLSWAQKKIGSNDRHRILVVTESIFSMDGDRAPLQEIVELKDKHGAVLLVDEAHAFGIIGPQGRGLAAELGVEDRIDLYIGTLSKAAGLSGGFLAGSQAYIDLCIQRARSFIYSTAPPPDQVNRALRSLHIIAGESGEMRRQALWGNLTALGHELGIPPPASAIVPIILGSSKDALAAANQLLADGYLMPAIRYPTVPRNRARLRLTVSSAHTHEQITAIAAAIRALPTPTAVD